MQWLVCWINRQFHQIIEHFGHEIFNVLVWRSQVGIGVNFDEPNTKIFINEEIKSKKFPTIFSIIRIELLSDTEEYIDNDVLDPCDEVLFNVDVEVLKRFIQVPLEVAVAQSITFFMLGVLV
jgi:hypothetical protein